MGQLFSDELLKWSMLGWMRRTLRGVVTMVDLTPCSVNRRAMSTIGIIWPGARKGRKNMCSLCLFSWQTAIAVEILGLRRYTFKEDDDDIYIINIGD